MRRAVFPVVASFLCSIAAFSQQCTARSCNTNPGTGGGGSGTASGGALSFSSPGTAANPTFVGGVSGRQGPAVTNLFNGSYASVAYTSTTPFDGQNDSYVYWNSGGNQYTQLNVTNGVAASSANPALQSAVVAGQRTLFMALNIGQVQTSNYGGLTGILSTTSIAQGGPWSYVVNLGGSSNTAPNYPSVSYSPSLAASSQYLFLGARNNADHTLTLCRLDITVQNGATTCNNFPGTAGMNFNPALFYWNNILYIGFTDQNNATHAVRMYTSTDNGQTVSENTNITAVNGDQASTQPAFVQANNALYIGFRSNDGSQSFLYKWSTDGVNWTSSTNAGISIVSAPALTKAGGYVQNFWGGNSNGGINLFTNAAAVQQ